MTNEIVDEIKVEDDGEHGTIESHESFGMIGISRIRCSHPVETFGSKIRNSNTIEITIRRADRRRRHQQTDYHGREHLTVIEMSPVQFAELITSANIGFGVPCSLRHVNGKDIPAVRSKTMFDTVKSEFKQRFKDLRTLLKSSKSEADEILGAPGRVKHEDKVKLLDMIRRIVQTVDDNIPYMETSLKEEMTKVVLEAKTEVSAFAEHVATDAGIHLIKDGDKIRKTKQIEPGEAATVIEVPQIGGDKLVEDDESESTGGT